MPGGNGTGPGGFGPMTGRGFGFCAGYQVPGYMNRAGFGRGVAHRRGFGRGFGRGYRNFPEATPVASYNESGISREDEVEYLKKTAAALENELKQVKEQLKELGDNNTE